MLRSPPINEIDPSAVSMQRRRQGEGAKKDEAGIHMAKKNVSH
jgi:hypothetical protein